MKVKFFISVIVLIGLGAMSYRSHSHQYSFNNVLDCYGWTTHAQKDAVRGLFEDASVVLDNRVNEQAFSERRTREQITHDIVAMVQETQQKLFFRAGGKERWEIDPLHWMVQQKENIQHRLKVLGFVDEVKPAQQNSFDAICILGGSRSRMVERINYANILLENGVQSSCIILLGGERYVTTNVDGTQEELEAIAKKYNITDWRDVTETQLIDDAYKNSSLSAKSLPAYLIDTPARDLPRPTTQTTIMELLSWLQEHPEVKSILFVSCQPYVLYQKAIIGAILGEQKSSIVFDVAGPCVTEDATIQTMVEAFGSYLWAAAPLVFAKLSIEITDPLAQQRIQELYGKNPLLHKAFPLKVS